jgi:hypothetical protein
MTQALMHIAGNDGMLSLHAPEQSKENSSEIGARCYMALSKQKGVFNHLQSVKLGTHKAWNSNSAHPRVLCVPVKGDARTQGFQHHALSSA